jgi:hypothetical protein
MLSYISTGAILHREERGVKKGFPNFWLLFISVSTTPWRDCVLGTVVEQPFPRKGCELHSLMAVPFNPKPPAHFALQT